MINLDGWKSEANFDKKVELAKGFVSLFYPDYCDKELRELWYYFKGFLDGALDN